MQPTTVVRSCCSCYLLPPALPARLLGLPLAERRCIHRADVLADTAASARMGAPVLGAPQPSILSSQWRGLLQAAAAEAFNPMCFIENEETDTQVPGLWLAAQPLWHQLAAAGLLSPRSESARLTVGAGAAQVWVFWRRQDRSICFAFRGTEQVTQPRRTQHRAESPRTRRAWLEGPDGTLPSAVGKMEGPTNRPQPRAHELGPGGRGRHSQHVRCGCPDLQQPDLSPAAPWLLEGGRARR